MAGAAQAQTAQQPIEGLTPTKADMEKARADREAGRKLVDPNRTRVETVRDKDNKVVEYVVESHITHIPYTVENKFDRPIETGPGSNSKSTLGTTQFIKLKW